MRIAITVREMTMRDEHPVEVRRASTQSEGRLTATGASKILRREFPGLPRTISRVEVSRAAGRLLC
jgi:hypothetical protein